MAESADEEESAEKEAEERFSVSPTAVRGVEESVRSMRQLGGDADDDEDGGDLQIVPSAEQVRVLLLRRWVASSLPDLRSGLLPRQINASSLDAERKKLMLTFM